MSASSMAVAPRRSNSKISKFARSAAIGQLVLQLILMLPLDWTTEKMEYAGS